MNTKIDKEISSNEIEKVTASVESNQISKVIVFNDNYHTYRQVVFQLMKAIGCSEETGFILTDNIHRNGKAEVFRGNIFDCVSVSSILKEINLKTQIVS